jgi:hypothetical protein
MASGYIAGSAPDDNQAMNQYWNGTTWVAIDSSVNPQDAVFYLDKTSARVAAAKLQQQFPNQAVRPIPVQRTVVLQISNSPEILPPSSSTPPPSS